VTVNVWQCPWCGKSVPVRDVVSDWPVCGCFPGGTRMNLIVDCYRYRLKIAREVP